MESVHEGERRKALSRRWYAGSWKERSAAWRKRKAAMAVAAGR
jgi:hypothetical protein